jgi:thioredoxin 1
VFAKVDVDKAKDVAEACKIKCMPTFQFFKGGEKIDELVGASSEKLKQLLAMHANAS